MRQEPYVYKSKCGYCIHTKVLIMENFVTCQKRMRAVDGKQEIYLEWPKENTMDLSILPVCNSLLSFLSQKHASFIVALLEIDCFFACNVVHRCFFIFTDALPLISGRGLKFCARTVFALAPSHSKCFRRLCSSNL